MWLCYSLCLILFRNQRSSVYDQSVGWTSLVAISGRCKRFSSSPKYSYLCWGPPSLLSVCPSRSFFNGVRELWHGMTTHLHLVLSLRMGRAVPVNSAVCLSSIHRDYFMFYFFNSVPRVLHIFCSQWSNRQIYLHWSGMFAV